MAISQFSSAMSGNRTPTALVVEDDGAERIRLALLLERLGYAVVSVADGAHALAELATHSFDVVVTDWQLPGITGLELCRTIQQISPASRPFTMLVTARDHVDDLVEGLDAGADDFLTKPYRGEELSARMRTGQRLLGLRRELASRTEMLERALRLQGDRHRMLNDEMAAAADLQQQLLSRATPAIDGLETAQLFRPTRQVGGDLFGVMPLGGQRVGFYHVDAVGHGVTAALHSFSLAVTLQGFGSRADGGMDPATAVRELDVRALADSPELACSIVIGWLDLGSRHGRLCQAGFPHPLAVSRNGVVRRLGAGGLPVGSLPNTRYENTEFELQSDERLVLHSDGIPDCVNGLNEAFGDERLESALRDHAGLALEPWIRHFGRAIDNWRGTANQDDDLSLLALEPRSKA